MSARPRLYVFVLIASLALAGCRSDNPAAAGRGANPQETRSVEVLQPQLLPFEEIVSATGSLLAAEEAEISLRVAGRIEHFNVDIGSCVQQGATLVRVDARDFQLREQQTAAALAQAEARLGLPSGADLDKFDPQQTATVKQARAMLEEANLRRQRAQQLHGEGILAAAELDKVMAEYSVADARYQEAYEEVLNRRAMVVQRRSELAIARQDLQDTQLRAPFSGCVQEKTANVGEFLNAGTRVVTLVRMDPLRLRLQVPEREASLIRPGQTISFRVEGDDRQYEARVNRISPAITQEGRMVVVESDVRQQAGLRPGQFARAEVTTATDVRALAVPQSALVSFAGIDKVLIVEEGRAVEREVQVGRRRDGMVEVRSGLAAEEQVVGNPQGIVPGSPVVPAA